MDPARHDDDIPSAPDAVVSEPTNPYEASAAVLPALAREKRPPALLAILACYVAHYLFEFVPLSATIVSDFELFMPTMAVIGVYGVAMCVALWHRQQWARVWLVFATVFTVFFLARMLLQGVSAAQWPALLAHGLRIAVGAMLFLPAIRRWFVSRAR